ncbi:unnamed protein product, partial [Rotaria sp. Silwood1]
YKTATSFAKRLLELGPIPDVAQQLLMFYYPQKEADLVEMTNIFDSLYVCIKIFHDLNAQVT